MPQLAPELNPDCTDCITLHVVGVNAWIGEVDGRPAVISQRQVHAGKVFNFVLADVHLRQEIEKLVAIARRRGIAFDEHYRALEVATLAGTGNGHNGHTKQLPIIEWVGHRGSVAKQLEDAQHSALDDQAEDRRRTTEDRERKTELGTDLATRNRIADSAAFNEAWRLYSTGESTLAECGPLLELTAEGMRQCFLRHKAADYHRAAKLWQRFHFRTRPERIRLFAQASAAA